MGVCTSLPRADVNETKSARYHRLKRRSAVLAAAMNAALLMGLLVSGVSVAMRDAVMGMTGSSAGSHATVSVFVLLLALGQETLALPLSFYRGFVVDRRYGMTTESGRSWLCDHLKGVAIRLVLVLGGSTTVYLCIRLWPRTWWLAAAVLFMGVMASAARLAPILIMPLFHRVTPLERESLRSRLIALTERAGVPVLGVYEWGLGEKSRAANAALVGAGATRRILVSDTMLADYSEDEIEVVLAHELAHHVHRDIPKALALEFLFLLVAFAVAAVALSAGWRPLGLIGPHDVAGLPLLLLTGGAVLLAATPLGHALSRRNERRADDYALNLTRQPGAFVSAMRRIAAQNLAEEHPSRATLWLFHTHPPVEQRIDAARTFGRSS